MKESFYCLDKLCGVRHYCFHQEESLGCIVVNAFAFKAEASMFRFRFKVIRFSRRAAVLWSHQTLMLAL